MKSSANRELMNSYMSSERLSLDPAYAPASSHLKGRPQHDWARFAGDPMAGYDPVLGYNSRWAKYSKKGGLPFTALRTTSASNLALANAITPLNIKPVVRRPPPRVPTPPQPHLYRPKSLEDLAPDLPERRGRKTTEFSVGDSSQMATFMAAHC